LAYRHSDIFGLSEPMSGYYSAQYLDSLGSKVTIPFQLKMACGSNDFLLNGNRSLANKLTSSGVDFTYKESIGAHEWHYWTGLMPQLLIDTSNFFHQK
jgi:enterochelin esterase-like enzyme